MNLYVANLVTFNLCLWCVLEQTQGEIFYLTRKSKQQKLDHRLTLKMRNHGQSTNSQAYMPEKHAHLQSYFHAYSCTYTPLVSNVCFILQICEQILLFCQDNVAIQGRLLFKVTLVANLEFLGCWFSEVARRWCSCLVRRPILGSSAWTSFWQLTAH